jgi:hypothetical protein
MLVTRFYDRRVVVCLLEKNLLWEEVGRGRSAIVKVVCLHGVRETASRGPVRVTLSIDKFMIAAIGDRDSQHQKANFLFLLDGRCLQNV